MIGKLKQVFLRAATLGSARWCPVCKTSSGRFLRYGHIPRKDARCPRCGALERHRFLWLYLEKRTDLLGGRGSKMLHVAPEAAFESRLRESLGSGYLTADMLPGRGMVQMDITDIDFPDGSFDVILCSHVLEHVHDDRAAMRELCRVLAPDGWALLLVPITAPATWEDSNIETPEDRLAAFGQEDHVRRYGPDYVGRLAEAGFEVETIRVSDLVSPEEARQMGLGEGSGEIFHCTRRQK